MDALPDYFESVTRALELDAGVLPKMESLARRFGFNSLTCWVATHDGPQAEGRIYELTTLSLSWSSCYDENAFLEVDPRVQATLNQALPVIWDRSTWIGLGSRIGAFVEMAAGHGIGSGVCVPLHDASFGLMRVDFESGDDVIDRTHHENIAAALGDLSMIARFLHDAVLNAVMAGKLRPRQWGRQLNYREQQCLTLAASGFSVGQVARDLRVPTPVIELHFKSIRGKLGVPNIHEAIALGLRDGLIKY